MLVRVRGLVCDESKQNSDRERRSSNDQGKTLPACDGSDDLADYHGAMGSDTAKREAEILCRDSDLP